MNLSTTSILIKKYLWIPGLISLLVIFGILIFFRSSPKSKTANLKLISKPDIATQPVQAATFSTSRLTVDKNIPKTLPVYKINNASDLRLNANALANKLKINAKTKDSNDIYKGQGLKYAGETGSLSVYKDYLSYQKILHSQKAVGAPNYKVENLVQEAQSFLASIINANQNWQDQQVTYNRDIAEDVIEDLTPSRSGSINIHLNYRLSDIKVLIVENDVGVTFNNSGDLIRANYRSLDTENTEGQYPLINFNTALNNLQRGDKKVVKVIGPGDVQSREAKILASVDLTKAYIAYFLPAKTPEILQPVWAFEGESKADNQSVYSTFVVPAIDPKFFIQSTAPKP